MLIKFLKKLFMRTPSPIRSTFGRTDTGLRRQRNEDSFCIQPDKQLFLVADGMGGHNAGEVASRVAIETLAESFTVEAIRRIKGNIAEIQHFYISAFHHANKSVMQMAQEDEAKSGMGCTLIGCLVDGDMAHICHVGDSRFYLLDALEIKQMTTDHSCVAAYEKNSTSGDTLLLARPPRQIVTRVIGFPFPEDPDYLNFKIKPGNRLLLCSDGLWSMLDDDTIHEIIMRSDTPEQACDTLIEKSNEAGGKDNITAVLIYC